MSYINSANNETIALNELTLNVLMLFMQYLELIVIYGRVPVKKATISVMSQSNLDLSITWNRT